MAISIPVSAESMIGIDEYIERVSAEVDVTDLERVAASAPMLAELANDTNLVVNELNRLVELQFRNASLTSAQSLFLGGGNGFYVRANIWPSSSDIASGRLYQDQFSYDVAHDHNYDFLTVHYLGPGYVTEIHEYDPDVAEGRPGEQIELRFLERTLFTKGTAMLYRASRDVHIQYPPDDLSITLNLMLSVSSAGRRDQCYFDIAGSRITEFIPEQESSKRVSLLKMAAVAGDDETRGLLIDLSVHHPCRRTRLAAFDSLAKLAPSDAPAIWERACDDPSPLVAREGRERLKSMEG